MLLHNTLADRNLKNSVTKQKKTGTILAQRGCGVFGDIQNPPECNTVQPYLGVSALAEWVGADDLQSSLPTPIILQFCDSVTLLFAIVVVIIIGMFR